MAAHPWKGEVPCSATYGNGNPCRSRAYYAIDNYPDGFVYVCGSHSRKRKSRRITLKQDPQAAEKRTARLDLEFTAWVKAAKANDGRGELRCQKMRMMQHPPVAHTFRNVFPNNRHGDRDDGIGMCYLSPMRMGPVNTGQPGLPPALSIENAHQFGKVFPSEVDDNGDPLPVFFETQRAAYLDPVPHRHKPQAEGKNKNVPLYSLWVTPDGKQHRISYGESRQFYCHWYAAIATGNPADDVPKPWKYARSQFKTLLTLLDKGHNLCITGYDGYDVTETLEEHYLDTSRPFGHEMVLFTLLTHPDEPDKWPWRKHATFELCHPAPEN